MGIKQKEAVVIIKQKNYDYVKEKIIGKYRI